MIPLHDDNPTRRFPAVTVALIAANVAVFVVQLSLPRWGITLEGWYYLLGARPFELTHHVDVPPFAWFPWWATLFTSMFVHGGWLHLIFNMWYLWIFGNNVEDAMTRPRFVALLLHLRDGGDDGAGARRPARATCRSSAPAAPSPACSAAISCCSRAQRVLTVIPLIIVWPVFEVPAWILLVVWFVLQGVGGAPVASARGRPASRSSPTSAASSPAWRSCCCSPGVAARPAPAAAPAPGVSLPARGRDDSRPPVRHDRRLPHPHPSVPPRGGRAARVRRARRSSSG